MCKMYLCDGLYEIKCVWMLVFYIEEDQTEECGKEEEEVKVS